MTDRLRITEIFYSLQGEANTVGIPTVFVRLTGCPLRCGYCDTAYAFHGGDWKTFDEILQTIQQYNTKYITITGGEPLAQKSVLSLMTLLCDKNFLVSLETSGALDVSGVDPRVSKVIDLKTPASGEMVRNRYENLNYLNAHDQIKFVICDRADYEWAKTILFDRKIFNVCTVLFSPVTPSLSPTDLANWILEDQLPVRFQVQLHKILWGNIPGK